MARIAGIQAIVTIMDHRVDNYILTDSEIRHFRSELYHRTRKLVSHDHWQFKACEGVFGSRWWREDRAVFIFVDIAATNTTISDLDPHVFWTALPKQKYY